MREGFYARLRQKRGDDDVLAACIDRVVNQLEDTATDGDKPGMLLGKIQSGKTRGFVGAIARAFDSSFDIAVVLTKGTKTLSAQTVARLNADLSDFIEDEDVLVLDIMKLPGRLTKSELKRKIIIVAKKQAQNLNNLLTFLRGQPALQNRKILLVDDEADLASVRFVKNRKTDQIDQGTIADQIDQLRGLSSGVAFLQVTATPYSLYLQPNDYDDAQNVSCIFQPKRPSFTELLPINEKYVGGDFFFGDFDEDDYRRYLYVSVSEDEQDALRREDKRRINRTRILDTPNAAGLRRAIVSFILAAGVRRWQQAQLGERPQKYAMIIHNDTQKAAQKWQVNVVGWIFEAVLDAATNDPTKLAPLFDQAYEDLSRSVNAGSGRMPDRDQAFKIVIDTLAGDEVVQELVNSDRDVMALLDEKAELRLRTGFNIFVGGNILDRGITIPKLISFYYGRNPKKMQADTVLQHSRMYGYRHPQDMLVTRFFTSQAVYDRLQVIDAFEKTLRKAFETGAHDKGVVFIQADANDTVRPCAPNKVLLSDVISLEPSGALLPTSFNTKRGRAMKDIQSTLETLIKPQWRDTGKFYTIDRSEAYKIIDLIDRSLEFDNIDFDWAAMKGLISYYLDATPTRPNPSLKVTAATGRRLDKRNSGEKSGRSIMGTALRQRAITAAQNDPVLVLLQQDGSTELGWNGHSFWWPVLVAPGAAEPCVFASKTAQ
ncbi:Z1 domain-containing protein [Antarcticirhabdus aurantiaca]|uniref:Uncharacterized protein n=1 Tax=Antarcticirhabdus aurantiaca TaxID=2606717 RepID=A0ACD4NRM7_9HYPH|nr:hypothetical protein OXU80_03440 [Jeongeuplla avenae]